MLLVFWLNVMHGAIAVAQTPSAEMLANTCAGCHGTNGSSVGPASPTIAGLSVYYFIETMQAFKTAQRPSTIMTRIAKGYTDEEIELMAGFFSRQSINRQAQATDAAKAEFGRRLHKKYCEKCHEKSGGSAEDDAGILAGQWLPYLQFTLQDFTGGERPMDKKMKERVDKLLKQQGEAGVEALLQFYASQQ
jgi:sulfide dehydrogenase cytochrome subunit